MRTRRLPAEPSSPTFLRLLGNSLRHLAFPLLVFLVCLQAFEIALMGLIH